MNIVAGIDEVGRGCWAGPLVAAAVVLNEPIAGLTDSKRLNKKRREQLAQAIMISAAYGIAYVWPEEIDSLGLTKATSRAMAEALDQIACPYDQVVIDGNYNYLPDNPHVVTIIKADLTMAAASAASILAKVARDNYMCEQAIEYPVYGFEKHVGYGTKLHIDALNRFGVCKLHRLSYMPVKAFLV